MSDVHPQKTCSGNKSSLVGVQRHGFYELEFAFDPKQYFFLSTWFHSIRENNDPRGTNLRKEHFLRSESKLALVRLNSEFSPLT